MNNKIKESFEEVAELHSDYLYQWYLENPVVVTCKRYNELKKVQLLLEKAILYFVNVQVAKTDRRIGQKSKLFRLYA